MHKVQLDLQRIGDTSRIVSRELHPSTRVYRNICAFSNSRDSANALLHTLELRGDAVTQICVSCDDWQCNRWLYLIDIFRLAKNLRVVKVEGIISYRNCAETDLPICPKVEMLSWDCHEGLGGYSRDLAFTLPN
jgi:hypothetical protein